MHSAESWSMIVDTPIFVRDSKYNAELCYWRGVLLTSKHARLLIAQWWLKMHISGILMDEIQLEYAALERNTNFMKCLTAETQESALSEKIYKFDKLYDTQTALSWLLEENMVVV